MQQAKFSQKNALNKIADFSVELLKNTLMMKPVKGLING